MAPRLHNRCFSPCRSHSRALCRIKALSSAQPWATASAKSPRPILQAPRPETGRRGHPCPFPPPGICAGKGLMAAVQASAARIRRTIRESGLGTSKSPPELASIRHRQRRPRRHPRVRRTRRRKQGRGPHTRHQLSVPFSRLDPVRAPLLDTLTGLDPAQRPTPCFPPSPARSSTVRRSAPPTGGITFANRFSSRPPCAPPQKTAFRSLSKSAPARTRRNTSSTRRE